jgi:hypothetical protein
MRLKRPYSFLLGHPYVNDGGIAIVREQNLSCERFGQACGTGHIAADDEYAPRGCYFAALSRRFDETATSIEKGKEKRRERLLSATVSP